MADDRIEEFSAELWAELPLGLELRADGLDVYWRAGEAPPWNGDAPGVELQAEEVLVDEDWLAGWRAAAAPFALGRRFWIDPAETPCDGAPAGRIPLHLPARRAFGTGSHASTRLAVRLLEEIPLEGRTVLDLGAGSGILSFVCRCLGARAVVGVELDLESVLLAGANARLNGIDVGLVGGTLAATSEAPFDVVAANLLSTELVLELGGLIARLASNGDFVYSGALTAEREDLLARFRRHDLEPVAEKIDDEWSAWRLTPRRAS